jgi:hypothetical protein
MSPDRIGVMLDGKEDAMATFVSINQLERGVSRASATVHAVKLPSAAGPRWLVYKPGTSPRTPLSFPDDVFRDLFAPQDAAAWAMFER